jgi:hypothetical protein
VQQPQQASSPAQPLSSSHTEQHPAEQPAVDTAEQPKRNVPEALLGAASPVLPPGHRSLADLGALLLFEKVMTSCDVSGHGRIVVPKVQHASHV